MNAAFSEVELGHRFSGRHNFDEAQVRAFANAAGDTNPLHHDGEFASASRYGRLIASGTHTTALLLGLTASHFSSTHSVVGISFHVDLRRPVYADARVTMEWVVTVATASDCGAQRLTMSGSMRDDAGETCISAVGVVQISALPQSSDGNDLASKSATRIQNEN